MTTDNIDLSSYDEITIDFSYIVNSFEGSEDFWLQISNNGGSSYTTVETYVRGTEFNNNERHNETVTIQGPFATNSRLRFRADATANNDLVYIDDVHIQGCGPQARMGGDPVARTEGFEQDKPEQNDLLGAPESSNFIQPTNTVPVPENSMAAQLESELMLTEINVFPNPSKAVFTVELITGSQVEQEVQFVVTDLSGRSNIQNSVVKTSNSRATLKLNLFDHPAGIYNVIATFGNTVSTMRLVKID